jgi:hypothetical protein
MYTKISVWSYGEILKTADTQIRLKSFRNPQMWCLICMEAIPLFLSANKPHLFSPTQHRFIVIQSVTVIYLLHVSVCT